VEDLKPGMRFRLEDGNTATVTKVEEPKVWEAPSNQHDGNGNYLRRVVGRIKRIGFVVLDLRVGGEVITTTPGHPFWSISREAWVGAGELHPGDLLRTKNGSIAKVEAVGERRYGKVELYNVEVEELHTYFVGRGESGVLAHNGLPGNCGIVKPAQAAEEAVAGPAQRRTMFHYTTEKGQKGILQTEELWPSTKAANPKDARYGDGQYLSDIAPGTKTPGQLSKAFLNDPRGWRRFTHWVEIDVTGLEVVEGRPGVSVILNNGNLDLLSVAQVRSNLLSRRIQCGSIRLCPC
jgi:hypothetical protein